MQRDSKVSWSGAFLSSWLLVAILGVCLVMLGFMATCWVVASRGDIGGYFVSALATALTILGVGAALVFAVWWIDRPPSTPRTARGFEVTAKARHPKG